MAIEYAVVQKRGIAGGASDAEIDCPQKTDGLEKLALAQILTKLAEYEFTVTHMSTTAQESTTQVTTTVLLQREK